jgi:DNA replication protein DnaC
MKFIFDNANKRHLTSVDFERARIPARLRRADLNSIPAGTAYKDALIKYLTNIDRHFNFGTGIVFAGQHGGGKSGSSIIIAKEVISRGGSVLFLEESALIDGVLRNEDYNDEHTIKTRAESVDLLIIDDLGLSPQSPNLHVTETLIKQRVHRQKTNIITTNLEPRDFKQRYRTISSALEEAAFIVECKGVAWRNIVFNEIKKD